MRRQASLVFAVPHLAFHLQHLERTGGRRVAMTGVRGTALDREEDQ